MVSFQRLLSLCVMVLCSLFFNEVSHAQTNVCHQLFKKECSLEKQRACTGETKLNRYQAELDFYKKLGFDVPLQLELTQKIGTLTREYRTLVNQLVSCEKTPINKCEGRNERLSFDGFSCECESSFQRNDLGQCEPIEICAPLINLRPLEEIRRRNDERFVASDGRCFNQARCASGTLRPLTSNLFICEVGAEICSDEYRPVCAHRRTNCIFGICYDIAKSFQNACWARHEKHYMVLDGECPEQNYCAEDLKHNETLNICVKVSNSTKPPVELEPIIIESLVNNPPVVLLKPEPKKTCKTLFYYDETKKACVPDENEILRRVCRAKRLKWIDGKCR